MSSAVPIKQPSVPVEIPPGTPEWISADLIRDTLVTWQPYYRKSLTVEAAIEILLDVGQLIALLGEP
ncbi:MAG: hypothetical protein DWQ31_16470 [Planctomycetota bacterium]|nr:MAG: hypothetical protein DWQ31_16470 [Planctomycetota bacterium]REJ92849.1 MAG: hypothetical protein DWQ35_11430 [Planctomycetota bacterium]REK24630.1 MAG: hypothetical protein DWQ42_13400 [Planctomycetota bacterium]REK38356.1 MAG: hypothetical protein DWQ46_20745 [Planctomycetota bacterium]